MSGRCHGEMCFICLIKSTARLFKGEEDDHWVEPLIRELLVVDLRWYILGHFALSVVNADRQKFGLGFAYQVEVD